ncbi:protein of unknown function [Pararobbsia alpina]
MNGSIDNPHNVANSGQRARAVALKWAVYVSLGVIAAMTLTILIGK